MSETKSRNVMKTCYSVLDEKYNVRNEISWKVLHIYLKNIMS